MQAERESRAKTGGWGLQRDFDKQPNLQHDNEIRAVAALLSHFRSFVI